MTTIDYGAYKDKKVFVRWVDVGSNERYEEGVIEAGSAVGAVFRIKGERKTWLIEASSIVSIMLVDDPNRVKQKIMPAVEYGRMREHLADRHNFYLSALNVLSEENAIVMHETIDHSDLGHRHRKSKPVENAVAEAEEESD